MTQHFQSFTVGKLDAGMILIGEKAHLIEFPSLLLPPGTQSGSIVSISVQRDLPAESSHQKAFTQLQSLILSTYGQSSPAPPQLILRNTTQTSVTLEWGKLELATAKLKGVDIYRNGTRLASIPNATVNTSTKLSSLALDTDYTFQLVMKTTAGTYPSNIIRVRTHTISDTSGISVCFGNVQDPQLLNECKATLDRMGAKYNDKIQIDTTHFVCTTPVGINGGSGPSVEYQKALQLSLPVVEPGWVLACLNEKKMVPISQHLLGTHSTTYNPTTFNRASLPSSPLASRERLPSTGAPDAVSPTTVPQPLVSDAEDGSAVGQDGIGLGFNTYTGEEGVDDRQEFKRPASRNGGVLNRSFKFPLSDPAGGGGTSTPLPLETTEVPSATVPIPQAARPIPPKEDAPIVQPDDEDEALETVELHSPVEEEAEQVEISVVPLAEEEAVVEEAPAQEQVLQPEEALQPVEALQPEETLQLEEISQPEEAPQPEEVPTSTDEPEILITSEATLPSPIETAPPPAGWLTADDKGLEEEARDEVLRLGSPSIVVQDMDSDLPPSPLEEVEKIEQERALEEERERALEEGGPDEEVEEPENGFEEEEDEVEDKEEEPGVEEKKAGEDKTGKKSSGGGKKKNKRGKGKK